MRCQKQPQKLGWAAEAEVAVPKFVLGANLQAIGGGRGEIWPHFLAFGCPKQASSSFAPIFGGNSFKAAEVATTAEVGAKVSFC